AQIDFFHMRKKSFVKTTDFLKIFSTNEHARAARPKSLNRIIILPFVFFQSPENTTATIRISEIIDKSAAGTGIFKMCRIFIIQNFGLNDSDIFIFFE